MKLLLSINAGLIALQAAIPQLDIATSYKSALAVACSIAIAMISTYIAPQVIGGIATKLSRQLQVLPPKYRKKTS